ncbi:glutamine-rich protein 2-like isoform X5 [Saccostrea echinata]|uniref:glutamine-rich protein 2-like isoform X5 n=1 Tax=Saccostrea echinata TaxID=191078 RepID=UPI002A81A75E|nr:glutamine-rich protein 2-like isoform X5 [Saccostrea echinata]
MPTQVKLAQMVDLALGTPEVGAVNFNVLHTLLHAMLKKLNILDVQAEINEFDRDFLSSSKQRQISSLSDIDSGRGEDSEDALSEKSTSIKSRNKSPYHHLEVKVAKMSEQLEKYGNELPTYKELFERGNMDPSLNTPVADVWKYIKIQKKVDANSDGLDELHNLVDGLMKNIKKLEQENKRLNDKISGLNIDDLLKRLADLEKKTDELNEKFSLLPTPEELAQYVTWPALEDALLGIKRDWENMQPQERVVVEISSQTDPPSRPVSSRPLSRVSTASSGPSAEVLDVLEKLGKLSESHDALTKRVEALEAEIKNKLDKDALENLNLSGDLLEQLSKLKEDLDALAQAREKGHTKSHLDEQERIVYNTRMSVIESKSDGFVGKMCEIPTVATKSKSAVVIQSESQNTSSISLPEFDSSDSDALSRAQQAILQLQAEVEKLHSTTKDIIEENNNRTQQIESLFQHCEKLQETKADKEYVQMEVDVKADKRSLDNKVNHSLFDSTTNEINKMIKDILDKLAGHEESWNSTIKKFADDIDGKLDRLELDPLKEWLESRLKALNDKLRRQQAQVEWTEDDAAGIRKQLIQRFHCISCDRPVDLVPTGPVPSLPTTNGLPPTRSPRPYTTFELDQIRQHAKRGPRNNINFERALAEKQLARMRKADLKAFLVHFGRDLEAYREQREEAARAAFAGNSGEVTDYYATTRACGGSHTTTFPNKRITRLSHLSHLFREEDGNVFPIYKEEVDVQGADGHIYKGRMGAKLEARLPSVTQEYGYKDMPQAYMMDRSRSPIPVPVSHRKTTVSPPPGHRVMHTPQRPTSARASPRRSTSRCDSRPQSAHPQNTRGDDAEESSHTTPAPDESAQSTEAIEVPVQGDA